jgi:hypothetical protein
MLNVRPAKGADAHPFAKLDPKPTRARLMSLLDPLGRKRYCEVERFLATVNGATSGLFYFNTAWGWAVRYMLGAKNMLCVLHLLPNQFEATVPLGKETDAPLKTAELSTEMKRRISRGKVQGGTRLVRMPIKNDHDYAGFQTLIKLKAEALKNKKPTKAEKDAAEAAAKPAAKPGAKPVAKAAEKAPAKAPAKSPAKSPAKTAAKSSKPKAKAKAGAK